MNEIQQYKQQAAEHAVEHLKSGMVIGLGHGSTTAFALQRIAQLLQQGALKDILGIPCSNQVARHATELGIPLTTLDEHPVIDVTIDGADEVDPDLNLIKGGGGALLREKIVAQASRQEIIVVDASKLSSQLGSKHPLPVEVAADGWQAQAEYLSELGSRPTLRLDADGEPFHTDLGNLILDCDFGPIEDPIGLNEILNRRAGILEHGLFIGLASEVIAAGPQGIKHLKVD